PAVWAPGLVSGQRVPSDRLKRALREMGMFLSSGHHLLPNAALSARRFSEVPVPTGLATLPPLKPHDFRSGDLPMTMDQSRSVLKGEQSELTFTNSVRDYFRFLRNTGQSNSAD